MEASVSFFASNAGSAAKIQSETVHDFLIAAEAEAPSETAFDTEANASAHALDDAAFATASSSAFTDSATALASGVSATLLFSRNPDVAFRRRPMAEAMRNFGTFARALTNWFSAMSD